MEVILVLAGILLSVALAGDNLLEILTAFAVVQFVALLGWSAFATLGKFRRMRNCR